MAVKLVFIKPQLQFLQLLGEKDGKPKYTTVKVGKRHKSG
jgi:hypothetical protein